ncbi:MAG: chemotaxis protein CheY, partial [Betaproteobacteria bacterium SG8_40]
VLSDGHFYRVGGHQPMHANVRVITATHQDLEKRVKEGLFREDLFHRLNVIRLRLPPLRERREDIPLLVRHFLKKCAHDLGVESKRLTDDAIKYLASRDWPGNVRQLENVCHWITVMAPGVTVDTKGLPPELREEAGDAEGGDDWVAVLEREAESRLRRGETGILDDFSRKFERAMILRALAHTGGRRIEASQLLGMGRNTLTRKVQELGIEEDVAKEKS